KDRTYRMPYKTPVIPLNTCLPTRLISILSNINGLKPRHCVNNKTKPSIGSLNPTQSKSLLTGCTIVCHEDRKLSATVQMMEEGPPESPCRRRFQTTLSGSCQ